MLNRNGMRPAFAGASAQGSSNVDREKMNGHISFSESQSESDDFNAFGSAPQKQKAAPKRPQPQPKKQPQQPKQKKPPVQIPVKAILAACGIIAAIILIIVITVAIFSAPKKEIRAKDNAYFQYIETTDAGEVTKIISNGKAVKQTFTGAVKIIPATDYSFAYIVEEVTADDNGRTAGFYTYVLKGTDAKALGGRADEMPQFAMLEPGIVYKQGSQFYYDTPSNAMPITAANKDTEVSNFIISNDAEVVVYTSKSVTADGKTQQVLWYFKDTVSEELSIGITPVALSNDGKYVFATDGKNLGYFEVKKNDGSTLAPTMMFTLATSEKGGFQEIIQMNTSGKEIVFSAIKGGELTSYLYTIGTKNALTEIGKGRFLPISAEQGVVCPDTFVNSYFECALDLPEVDINDEEDDEENEDEDEDTDTNVPTYTPTVATYFFDKNSGARHIANESGQFSPDMKYFYYIDGATAQLMKVTLNSKDFKKDTKSVFNSVSNFKVVEKGDLYIMHENTTDNLAKIYFIDASSGKPDIIAEGVDLGSMQYCANSIYFSITKEEVPTIYVSTNGSAMEAISFKSGAPTETPTVAVTANGMGDSAYAYFADTNGTVHLYYTSNGKKLSEVVKNCIIADFEASVPSEPATDSSESDSESAAE